MKVRRARPADLSSILALNTLLFDFEQQFGKHYNMDWTFSQVGKTYFQKRILDTQGICLVVEINKELVGYLVSFIGKYPYRSDVLIAEVENMFVVEKHRRRGIGKALIKELIEQLKERGVKRIKVEARGPNEIALQFYKAMGFSDFNLILEREV